MVAENEKAILTKRYFAYVFTVFLKNVDLMSLGFGFEECFETGFVFRYSWVRFIRQDFFKYYLPGTHIGSDIVEGAAVDLNVHWRFRWTVKDCMEGYVSAQAM